MATKLEDLTVYDGEIPVKCYELVTYERAKKIVAAWQASKKIRTWRDRPFFFYAGMWMTENPEDFGYRP